MSRIAFLFPGQGAQAVGMGRQFAESLPAARQLFDEAAELLGYNLAEVCWNGPAERLNSTVISQPAIFGLVVGLAASLEATEFVLEDDLICFGCHRHTVKPVRSTKEELVSDIDGWDEQQYPHKGKLDFVDNQIDRATAEFERTAELQNRAAVPTAPAFKH